MSKGKEDRVECAGHGVTRRVRREDQTRLVSSQHDQTRSISIPNAFDILARRGRVDKVTGL